MPPLVGRGRIPDRPWRLFWPRTFFRSGRMAMGQDGSLSRLGRVSRTRMSLLLQSPGRGSHSGGGSKKSFVEALGDKYWICTWKGRGPRGCICEQQGQSLIVFNSVPRTERNRKSRRHVHEAGTQPTAGACGRLGSLGPHACRSTGGVRHIKFRQRT